MKRNSSSSAASADDAAVAAAIALTKQEQSSSSSSPSSHGVVVHNDSLDLDEAFRGYSGPVLVSKLLFVARRCPERSLAAFRAALRHIRSGVNVDQYMSVAEEARAAHAETAGPQEFDTDQDWVRAANSLFNHKAAELEDKLNRFKRDPVRAKIRQGYLELGDCLLARGEFTQALNQYLESKEYSSNKAETVESCLRIVRTSVYMGNLGHVKTQVERATMLGADLLADNPTMTAQLHAALGLYWLRRSDLAQAASSFLKVTKSLEPPSSNKDSSRGTDGDEKSSSSSGLSEREKNGDDSHTRVMPSPDWRVHAERFNDVVALRDVALYAVVCVLTEFSRAQLKSKVFDNDDFRDVLEHNDSAQRLLKSFNECRYGDCLDVLASIEKDMMLDAFIGEAVRHLVRRIRNRTVSEYFSTFVSVRIESMAEAFHMQPEQLQSLLVTLIGENKIQGRIDAAHGIVHSKSSDERVSTYDDALKAGRSWVANTKSTLLRINLIKQGFVVDTQDDVLNVNGTVPSSGRKSGSKNNNSDAALASASDADDSAAAAAAATAAAQRAAFLDQERELARQFNF